MKFDSCVKNTNYTDSDIVSQEFMNNNDVPTGTIENNTNTIVDLIIIFRMIYWKIQ